MKTLIFRRSRVANIAATALLACASLLGGASLASARDAAPSEESTVAVTYADLDLSSPAGAQTMFYRIQTAAVTACERPPEGVGKLEAWIDQRACQQQTVDELVAKLNAPLVTSLNGRSAAEVAQR